MRTSKLTITESNQAERLVKTGKNISSGVVGVPVGTQIYLIRRCLGMSQSQLAHRAKVSKPQLVKIERNSIESRVVTLRRLFTALGCELVLLPRANTSLGQVVRERAEALAIRKINQTLGTMTLEAQPVAKATRRRLVKEEWGRLMGHPSSALWDE